MNVQSKQFSKMQCSKLIKSGWWLQCDDFAIALIQLDQEQVCCPTEIFHKAVSNTLKREVSVSEFDYIAGLRAELYRVEKDNILLEKKSIYSSLDLVIGLTSL